MTDKLVGVDISDLDCHFLIQKSKQKFKPSGDEWAVKLIYSNSYYNFICFS